MCWAGSFHLRAEVVPRGEQEPSEKPVGKGQVGRVPGAQKLATWHELAMEEPRS